MTARSNSEKAMLDQAVAWAAALESDDVDWDGYMAWLEADPRHRAAFDSIALVSAAVDDHRAEIGDERHMRTRVGFHRRGSGFGRGRRIGGLGGKRERREESLQHARHYAVIAAAAKAPIAPPDNIQPCG